MMSGDNPRIYHEFKRLFEKDVMIETILSADELPDLSQYKNPVIVFNYFDNDNELVEKVLQNTKNIKIVPVYYR